MIRNVLCVDAASEDIAFSDVLGRVLPGDGSVDVWTRWQGSRNACRLEFRRIGEVVWDKSGASAKMAVARRLGKAVRTVTGKATA